MCGICGQLNFDRRKVVSPQLLRSMADTIFHRGPDDEGYYRSGSVGLGFRRLSIIDLSAGHQPLANEDNTVWIVFNGEIYNHVELRVFLEAKGHQFKTRTDTEVIVHLYEEFGARCVERLRGMFAFAIWDARLERLVLARDRVGIKPLYYHLSSGSITFASEIKAILMNPDVTSEVDWRMIDRFMTFYYLPGTHTLLRNIRKLEPGTYLIVQDGEATTTRYWDLSFNIEPRTVAQAESELVEILEESVRLHMIADVPVGFLLSGGFDSTAILSTAVGKTDHQLSTFTVGFSNPGVVDERPYARIAADRYATEHHEITISSKDFADFLPNFAWYMEEPCCEPQAVALYYVTRKAKQHVKVLISGEGGDEAFAGYPVYRNLLWFERIKKLTGPINGVLSTTLRCVNRARSSPRLNKYSSLLPLPIESYYYSRTSHPALFFNSRTVDLYSPDFLHHVDRSYSTSLVQEHFGASRGAGTLNQMLYMDLRTSLPDDILLKADKMTMANSVELRVPFLDHKVLEFAASLPENFKISGFTAKYLVKLALRNRVPKEIIERKKAGFPVPYDAWMRTELKDWVRSILLDPRTLDRGYFNRKCIEQIIRTDSQFHVHPKELFSLVSLELWHRSFVDRPATCFESTRTPVASVR